MIQHSHSWAYVWTKLYFRKIHAPLCSMQHYPQRPKRGNHPNVHWPMLPKEVWLPWERPQRTETHERSPRSHHLGLISPQSHTRGLTEEVFKMTPAPSWTQPSKRSHQDNPAKSHIIQTRRNKGEEVITDVGSPSVWEWFLTGTVTELRITKTGTHILWVVD